MHRRGTPQRHEMEMNMPEISGPDYTDDLLAFDSEFEANTKKSKPHSGTWAETFETLGCALIVLLCVLGCVTGVVALAVIAHKP
jgi:hypothetical protein